MQPMTWPDHISVYHKLRSRPDENTESIILDAMILSHTKQRPAARCLEDIVVYDYRSSKKTTLPSFILDQFKQTYDLQEQAKSTNQERIQALFERVTLLERESWDRPDAQEDFGSLKPA
jgi:Thioesterase-like superfamily